MLRKIHKILFLFSLLVFIFVCINCEKSPLRESKDSFITVDFLQNKGSNNADSQVKIGTFSYNPSIMYDISKASHKEINIAAKNLQFEILSPTNTDNQQHVIVIIRNEETDITKIISISNSSGIGISDSLFLSNLNWNIYSVVIPNFEKLDTDDIRVQIIAFTKPYISLIDTLIIKPKLHYIPKDKMLYVTINDLKLLPNIKDGRVELYSNKSNWVAD